MHGVEERFRGAGAVASLPFVVEIAVERLDGFDQIGRRVGDVLGRLDKVPLGDWIGRLGGCESTNVAEGGSVLGDGRSRGQHRLNRIGKDENNV